MIKPVFIEKPEANRLSMTIRFRRIFEKDNDRNFTEEHI